MPANFTDWVIPLEKSGVSFFGVGQGYDGEADVQIKVDGDQLIRDGRRYKNCSVNLSRNAAMPSKSGSPSDAKKLAQNLRYFGINCVRIHQIDQDAPLGICDSYPAIDESTIDLFENFISECKQAGVYVNLSLHVMSLLRGNDGQGTASVMFIDAEKEKYKTFLDNILDRINPYIGLQWSKDPVIAFIEILNEEGLMHDYFTNRVDNYTTQQITELKVRWTSYLATLYTDTAALVAAWGSGNTGTEGNSLGEIAMPVYDSFSSATTNYADKNDAFKTDWINFITKIEVDYITELKQYINDKSDALVIAGQINYMSNQAAAIGDIIDAHSYYDRPARTNTSPKDTVMSFGPLSFDSANNRIIGGSYNFQTTAEVVENGFIAIVGTTSNDGVYKIVSNESAIAFTVEQDLIDETVADLSLQNVTLSTKANWSQSNETFIKASGPTLNTWGDICGTQQKGKPFFITECNYGGFNVHGFEQMLFYFSQMSYQDMDGIDFFNYGLNNLYDEQKIQGDLVFDKNPAKMIAFALMSQAFRDGDILPAIDEVNKQMTDEAHTQAVVGYEKAGSDVKLNRAPLGSATHYSQTRCLQQRTYTTPSNQDTDTGVAVGILLNPATSDTSQLVFDRTASAERYLIKSLRCKSFYGYINNNLFVDLGHGVIYKPPQSASNDVYGLLIKQTAGLSFNAGGRFIIAVMGECKNSGMLFNQEPTDLNYWGGSSDKVQVDLQASSLILPIESKRCRLYPLDESGSRGLPIDITKNATVQLDFPANTPLFELVVVRNDRVNTSSSKFVKKVTSSASAGITVNNITSDNIINNEESLSVVAVTGIVSGDAAEGDAVQILVNGNTYSSNVLSDYTYSVVVPGSDLALDNQLQATVSGTANSGHAFSKTEIASYSVKTTASAIFSNIVTNGNNLVNAEQVLLSTLTLSGSIAGDASPGHNVSVVVNAIFHSTVLDANNNFSFDIPASDLYADDTYTITIFGEDSVSNELNQSIQHSHTNIPNPIVQTLTAPATSNSLTFSVTINALQGTSAIADYLIIESQDTPQIDNASAEWATASNTSTFDFTASQEGNITLWSYVRDSNGNINIALISRSVDVSLQQAGTARVTSISTQGGSNQFTAHFSRQVVDLGATYAGLQLDVESNLDVAHNYVKGGGQDSWAVTYQLDSGTFVEGESLFLSLDNEASTIQDYLDSTQAIDSDITDPYIVPASSALTLTLGNDAATDGANADGWLSNLVINESDAYTNNSNNVEQISINQFAFYARQVADPVTPLIVLVNGDNDFTVIAIGTTRIAYSVGENIVPFSDGGSVVSLNVGQTLATGFIDANADGSGGGAGSVIAFDDGGDQIWYTGGPAGTDSGSVTIGQVPVEGLFNTVTTLNRNYHYQMAVSGVSNAAPSLPTLVGTVNPPQATVGVPYSYTFASAFSGDNITDYPQKTGAMGNGLTYDSSTVTISGTPLLEVDLTNLSFCATDGTNDSSTTSAVTLSSVAASAGWTINKNFEAGQIGDNAMNDGIGFDGFAQSSVYTGSPTHSGNRAIKCVAAQGDKSSNKWGGQWDHPNIGKGGQIWYRAWIYFPLGFDFTASSEGLKNGRIHVKASNGNHVGYHHDYISQNSAHGKLYIGGSVRGSDNKHVFDNYPTWTDAKLRGAKGEDVGPSFPGVAQILRGQWFPYEQYVYFDERPNFGVRRTWIGGVPVFEDLKTATLHSATDKCDFIYHWTYWNNGSPTDQECFIDDVVITTQTPSLVDVNGNPFVGLN